MELTQLVVRDNTTTPKGMMKVERVLVETKEAIISRVAKFRYLTSKP